jgi:hypothetical protein
MGEAVYGKCKEGKVIANHVLELFFPGQAVTALHSTLSTVKSYGDVATLT